MVACRALDEVVEVVEVPAGEFSSNFEAGGWLGMAQDVQGHVFNVRHVFGAVAGPQPRESPRCVLFHWA